jgi:predicted transcriptional regulator
VKSSTTLKLPRELKNRIAKIAKKTRRTPHAFMVEALQRETEREEKFAAFVHEAREADRAIDAGADVYDAADVHAWLERLAQGGKKPPRPKPWRG